MLQVKTVLHKFAIRSTLLVSAATLLATLALGLFFWVIIFAVLISLNPAGH